MINAIKNFFKGYVDFLDVQHDADYWWIWLVNLILSIPFYMVYGAAMANPDSEAAVMTFGSFRIYLSHLWASGFIAWTCIDSSSST